MSDVGGFKAFLTIGGTYYEFVTQGISGGYELIDDEDGIRGTRSRTLERATQGNFRGGGDLKINPTPLELSGLWPYLVNSTTGVVLTDAMQDVTVVVDMITKKLTFVGRFAKGVLSGESGKKLDLTISFVAKSMTEGASSLSGIPDITNRPYMCADSGSGCTIGGVAYSFTKFELSIDNHIEPTYMQGQAPTDLEPQDREVRLNVNTKYTSTEAALQTLALTGPVLASPVVGSLAFTNGANSATFAMGALVAVPKSVTVPSKKMLRWDGEFHAYKVGTTLEVVPTFV